MYKAKLCSKWIVLFCNHHCFKAVVQSRSELACFSLWLSSTWPCPSHTLHWLQAVACHWTRALPRLARTVNGCGATHNTFGTSLDPVYILLSIHMVKPCNADRNPEMSQTKIYSPLINNFFCKTYNDGLSHFIIFVCIAKNNRHCDKNQQICTKSLRINHDSCATYNINWLWCILINEISKRPVPQRVCINLEYSSFG